MLRPDKRRLSGARTVGASACAGLRAALARPGGTYPPEFLPISRRGYLSGGAPPKIGGARVFTVACVRLPEPQDLFIFYFFAVEVGNGTRPRGFTWNICIHFFILFTRLFFRRNKKTPPKGRGLYK